MKEELELIKRGTVELITEEELIKKLKNKKKLNIKFGADPTAPDIHLGHTVILQKLRHFQDLGHTVYFIIGDFTAMIGDPSGKIKTRPGLSKSEIEKNAITYEKQVFKILRKDRTVVVRNSQWLSNMKLEDIMKLSSFYTVSKMLEREDFKKRYKENISISILEFLYPLLQGYDSVYLKADVEVGGEDQIFNLLIGRDIQRAYGIEEQVVLTLPLLEGTDGVKKMSKTYGNYIGIDEESKDIFGKIMSIPDSLIEKYTVLLTELMYKKEKHPKEMKKEIAYYITEKFKGKSEAERAKENFEKIFEKREMPEELPEKEIKKGEHNIVNLIKQIYPDMSKTEIRRLITQKAVEIDGKIIDDFRQNIFLNKHSVIRVGKRKFFKITALPTDESENQ